MNKAILLSNAEYSSERVSIDINLFIKAVNVSINVCHSVGLSRGTRKRGFKSKQHLLSTINLVSKEDKLIFHSS